MPQVQQYNPPPNPAKMEDPRAEEYVAKHGSSSWEVDALPPNVLAKIIRKSLDGLVNKTRMNKIIIIEEHDKERLRKFVGRL